MKLSITKKALGTALARAGSIVDPKSPHNLSKHVLLDATGSTLVVRSTDLVTGLRDVVECAVKDGGALTAPHRQLTEMVGAMPEGDVSLTLKKGKLEFVSGKRKLTVSTLDAADFPSLKDDPAEVATAELSGKALASVIRRTMHAANLDNSRPYICGVQVELGHGALSALATSGAAGAIATVSHTGQPFEMFLPLRTLKTALDICEANETVKLWRGANLGRISSGATVLEFLLVSGQFPPFRQVVPKPGGPEATVDSDALANALQAVSAAGEAGRSSNVDVDAGDGAIRLRLEGKDATGVDEVEAQTEGSFRTILSASQAIACLKAAGGIVTVACADELDPVVFRVSGIDESFVGVVMPIRREAAQAAE